MFKLAPDLSLNFLLHPNACFTPLCQNTSVHHCLFFFFFFFLFFPKQEKSVPTASATLCSWTWRGKQMLNGAKQKAPDLKKPTSICQPEQDAHLARCSLNGVKTVKVCNYQINPVLHEWIHVRAIIPFNTEQIWGWMSLLCPTVGSLLQNYTTA